MWNTPLLTVVIEYAAPPTSHTAADSTNVSSTWWSVTVSVAGAGRRRLRLRGAQLEEPGDCDVLAGSVAAAAGR